ncbi:hypothetical protein M8C21_024748, partial [Ambrosia artemisiifolia]
QATKNGTMTVNNATKAPSLSPASLEPKMTTLGGLSKTLMTKEACWM